LPRSRQAGLHRRLAEPVERRPGGVGAAEALHQRLQFVDHEDGLVADGVVTGMVEVFSISRAASDLLQTLAAWLEAKGDPLTVAPAI
jgi:hypothetical protein